MDALITKIIPFSSVDGPGNRTAVFLQGCNIDCKYCHNPETRPNRETRLTTRMTPEEVMDRVRRQIPFIRGISVSGGECMQHPDFLTELFRLAKAEGLTTLIDTNGTIPFEGQEELLSVTDGVMLDIKAFRSEEHEKITGEGNEEVLRNAVFLSKRDKLYEVRFVIVPELYDTVRSVREAGEFLGPLYREHPFRIKLIAYRPQGVRPKYAIYPSPTKQDLESLREMLKRMGFEEIILI